MRHRIHLSLILPAASLVALYSIILFPFSGVVWEDGTPPDVISSLLLVVCLLYILTTFYYSQFYLFFLKMSDGRRPLAKFSLLIAAEMGLAFFSMAFMLKGCVHVHILCSLSATLCSLLIAAVMFYYFREMGRRYISCIRAYLVYFAGSFISFVMEMPLPFATGDVLGFIKLLMITVMLAGMGLFIISVRRLCFFREEE